MCLQPKIDATRYDALLRIGEGPFRPLLIHLLPFFGVTGRNFVSLLPPQCFGVLARVISVSSLGQVSVMPNWESTQISCNDFPMKYVDFPSRSQYHPHPRL